MSECCTCLHEKVCELWQANECQNAACFFPAECGLYTPAVKNPPLNLKPCPFCGGEAHIGCRSYGLEDDE